MSEVKIPYMCEMLLNYITALSKNNESCDASNEFFAKTYKVSLRTVQRWLAVLKQNGMIETLYQDENKRLLKPRLNN